MSEDREEDDDSIDRNVFTEGSRVQGTKSTVITGLCIILNLKETNFTKVCKMFIKHYMELIKDKLNNRDKKKETPSYQGLQNKSSASLLISKTTSPTGHDHTCL